MNNALAYCVYIIKNLVRNLARILFVFPIKKGRLLFSSYDGEKIGDNPKCIYDFMTEHYPDQYEYIWVYKGNVKKGRIPENVKVVKKNSLKWFYFMATSQVIVNDCVPSILVPKRKNQFYLETWHAGGAYKKVGIATAKTKTEEKAFEKAKSVIDLFVSSSEGFTKGDIVSGYNYHGKILNCGMPRNDIFFNSDAINYSANKVKDYYSLHGLVVLYAPTYRGDLKHSDEIIDVLNIKRLTGAFKKRYGETINILFRCHHWDKHNYSYSGDVVNVSDYPDMQELLCACDILITDYSSSMWDFALLGRPCLLYTPDLDYYIQSRGFFTPIEQWPGIVCKDMNRLCEEIIKLNENKCAIEAREYLELMGSYETGHATKTICDKINEII